MKLFKEELSCRCVACSNLIWIEKTLGKKAMENWSYDTFELEGSYYSGTKFKFFNNLLWKLHHKKWFIWIKYSN